MLRSKRLRVSFISPATGLRERCMRPIRPDPSLCRVRPRVVCRPLSASGPSNSSLRRSWRPAVCRRILSRSRSASARASSVRRHRPRGPRYVRDASSRARASARDVWHRGAWTAPRPPWAADGRGPAGNRANRASVRCDLTCSSPTVLSLSRPSTIATARALTCDSADRKGARRAGDRGENCGSIHFHGHYSIPFTSRTSGLRISLMTGAVYFCTNVG